MIHRKANRIPKLRNDLPFIQQFGLFPFKECVYIHFGKNHIPIQIRRIRNIVYAVGLLL